MQYINVVLFAALSSFLSVLTSQNSCLTTSSQPILSVGSFLSIPATTFLNAQLAVVVLAVLDGGDSNGGVSNGGPSRSRLYSPPSHLSSTSPLPSPTTAHVSSISQIILSAPSPSKGKAPKNISYMQTPMAQRSPFSPPLIDLRFSGASYRTSPSIPPALSPPLREACLKQFNCEATREESRDKGKD